MLNNTYQKITITTIGTFCSLVASAQSPARAFGLKFEFFSSIDGDNLGQGILLYDDAPITGIGVEQIQMKDLVNVNLDLDISAEISIGPFTDTISFDETDVVPPSPFLTFIDGKIRAFEDTLNGETDNLNIPIEARALGTTFEAFATVPGIPNPVLVEQGTITFTDLPEPIPEPISILTSITAAGAIGILKKEHSRKLQQSKSQR